MALAVEMAVAAAELADAGWSRLTRRKARTAEAEERAALQGRAVLLEAELARERMQAERMREVVREFEGLLKGLQEARASGVEWLGKEAGTADGTADLLKRLEAKVNSPEFLEQLRGSCCGSPRLHGVRKKEKHSPGDDDVSLSTITARAVATTEPAVAETAWRARVAATASAVPPRAASAPAAAAAARPLSGGSAARPCEGMPQCPGDVLDGAASPLSPSPPSSPSSLSLPFSPSPPLPVSSLPTPATTALPPRQINGPSMSVSWQSASTSASPISLSHPPKGLLCVLSSAFGKPEASSFVTAASSGNPSEPGGMPQSVCCSSSPSSFLPSSSLSSSSGGGKQQQQRQEEEQEEQEEEDASETEFVEIQEAVLSVESGSDSWHVLSEGEEDGARAAMPPLPRTEACAGLDDEEDYEMVEAEDVVESISLVLARYLATHPEYKAMTAEELQQAIGNGFRDLRGHGVMRSLWEWGKFAYKASRWVASAYSLYRHPLMVRAILMAILTSSRMILGMAIRP